MNQESFRSVVCRSLSKSLPSRSKDGSNSERTQCDSPYVVTLQPTVCRRCESQDWSPTKSNWEERSILSQRDYVMGSSLSRHFAEDLLRDAMDLQESLRMLEKFQTVSRSMRQSNKKRRPETGERSLDVTGIREALFEASSIAKKVVPGSVSNRFDGQLRSSTDDLKRVIKDSLYRTNDEQASLSQSARYTRNSSVVSESTKHKKVAPRSLSCTPMQPDRSKSPSLVARLMGLEGLPLHKGITTKKDGTLKTVGSPRAQFDIEMPKSKTLPPERLPKQSIGKDSYRKEKAGQEIMKAIQVKRILKTTTSDERMVQHQNVQMNYPYSRRDILPSQDTSGGSEHGSVKSIRREQRTVQARTKVPEDVKVVSHVTRKQRLNENTETNRRSNNMQKHHLDDRNREGRKDAKAKTASASRTNSKLVKSPDKKLILSSSSPSTCRAVKPASRRAPGNSRVNRVSSRSIKNSIIDEVVAYEAHSEFAQTDGPSTEHSATPSDASCQSTDWDTATSIHDIQEDFRGSNEASTSSPVERTKMSADDDEDDFYPPVNRTPTKEAEIKDVMSLLLLSDRSFLTRAAQLVGIHTYDHLIEQYEGSPKDEVKDRQLYVDVAAEQLERKHRQQNSPRRTVFKCRVTPYLSLVALLGDISTGTRKLKSYTDSESYGSGSKYSLSVKLERDLRCLEPSINSAWDMGWQDWMCMEETELWARDAGESVLSSLIEEVALEMLVW